MQRIYSHFAVIALLLQGGSARAQTSDPAAAQALFDEAKQLMARGKLGEACPKFLLSFNLDAKPGAMLNLADCYEKNGQTASAWARYLEAAALTQRTGQAEREQYARAHAAALESKLSRLAVVVPSAPRGLTITRDGIAVDPTAWGIVVPVDPGKHVVEARVNGRLTWSFTIDVGAGDARARVTVPASADVPAPPPPSSGSGQRTLGWIGVGTGVAFSGVAIGTGVAALSAKGTFDASNHTDGAAHDRAATLRTWTNVVWGAAAVTGIAGVTLLLTALSKPRAAAYLHIDPRGLAVGRSF
jgi:hypothetical protein